MSWPSAGLLPAFDRIEIGPDKIAGVGYIGRRRHSSNAEPENTGAEITVAQIIENAKVQISKIAGLTPDRVKVHVECVAE